MIKMILIIILAGNYGANSGAGVTAIEFNSKLKCEMAKEVVLQNDKVTRITAYCIEK